MYIKSVGSVSINPCYHGNLSGIFLLQVFLIALFSTTTQGICNVVIDSRNAFAVSKVLNTTYSCVPCVKADYEVHVIKIYKPSGHHKRLVNVYIDESREKGTNIKLVLISHEATDWFITYPYHTRIQSTHLVSNNGSSTVRRQYYGSRTFQHNSTTGYFAPWEDVHEMEKFVVDKLGLMTSYTGTYQTHGFTLFVGKCIKNEPLSLPASGYIIISLIILGVGAIFIILCVASRRAQQSQDRSSFAFLVVRTPTTNPEATDTNRERVGESALSQTSPVHVRTTTSSGRPELSSNPPAYEEAGGGRVLEEITPSAPGLAGVPGANPGTGGQASSPPTYEEAIRYPAYKGNTVSQV